jgi:hypothetical protein
MTPTDSSRSKASLSSGEAARRAKANTAACVWAQVLAGIALSRLGVAAIIPNGDPMAVPVSRS